MGSIMDLKHAAEVLERNYKGEENCLIYDLHEMYRFSIAHFWDYYDCVIVLAKAAISGGRSIDTAMKITVVYQWILKEIIYHFDNADSSKLKGLPGNYPEYIERLDGALDAYFRGIFTEDSAYDLQR